MKAEIGKKYNKLTLIEKIDVDYSLFLCDCGKTKKIRTYNVVKNKKQTMSCGCLVSTYKLDKAKKDYLNKKYGNLEIVDIFLKNRQFQVICKCSCGNSETRTLYGFKKHDPKMCKKCLKKKYSEIYSGNKNPGWRGCNKISSTMLNSIKSSAIKRKIEFNENITCEFLWNLLEKQNFKCAISGQQLYVENPMIRESYNISLDRIDSSIGYTPSNVHWVTKKINTMKMDLSLKEFIEICKNISDFN